MKEMLEYKKKKAFPDLKQKRAKDALDIVKK